MFITTPLAGKRAGTWLQAVTLQHELWALLCFVLSLLPHVCAWWDALSPWLTTIFSMLPRLWGPDTLRCTWARKNKALGRGSLCDSPWQAGSKNVDRCEMIIPKEILQIQNLKSQKHPQKSQLVQPLHLTDKETEVQTVAHSHGAGVGLTAPLSLPLPLSSHLFWLSTKGYSVKMFPLHSFPYPSHHTHLPKGKFFLKNYN